MGKHVTKDKSLAELAIKLRRRCEDLGFEVFPGANLDDIHATMKRLAWPEGDTLQNLYLEMNGVDGFSDEMVTMWPLQKLTVRTGSQGRCLRFADWLVDSEEYGILESTREIILIEGTNWLSAFPDLDAFLRRWLAVPTP